MKSSIFERPGKVVVDGDGELLVGNKRISRKDNMYALRGIFGKEPRYLSSLVEEVDLALKNYEAGVPVSRNYPAQKEARDYHQKRN